MHAAERKLFLGPRVRRIRRELGLSQTLMAEQLGLSPSYLNLIERNQRPVTAQVLLRFAERCNVDLKQFSSDTNTRLAAQLDEIARDPVLHDLSLSRAELMELIEICPAAAEAIQRLYRAYRNSSETRRKRE
jgi:transcriptional regulator with XRE-family HTH domain